MTALFFVSHFLQRIVEGVGEALKRCKSFISGRHLVKINIKLYNNRVYSKYATLDIETYIIRKKDN